MYGVVWDFRGFYLTVCALGDCVVVVCGCVGCRGHYGTVWCFMELCGL